MLTTHRPLIPSHLVLPPFRAPLRRALCQTLHALSERLARLAMRLATSHAERIDSSAVPSVEFHAEAGALEGALYVDGVLIGHLDGVSRL